MLGPFMSLLCENDLKMSFFLPRAPPQSPKPCKNQRFLTSPRRIFWPARAPKPCKNRCFLTPHAKNTVNYGTSVHVTSPRFSPGWVIGPSAAGGASVYNLRLPPKASGKGTGAWPAPGLRANAPCRRPLEKWWPEALCCAVWFVSFLCLV